MQVSGLVEELKELLLRDAESFRKTGLVPEGSKPLAEMALETIEAQAAEIERLRTDVLRVVDGAHPYRDESGIIEIPLHTFGLLWRIADEARAALQPAPDGLGEA